MVLQEIFQNLYSILSTAFPSIPNTDGFDTLFWVHGLAMLGTIALVIAPFYLLYKVFRWLV